MSTGFKDKGRIEKIADLENLKNKIAPLLEEESLAAMVSNVSRQIVTQFSNNLSNIKEAVLGTKDDDDFESKKEQIDDAVSYLMSEKKFSELSEETLKFFNENGLISKIEIDGVSYHINMNTLRLALIQERLEKIKKSLGDLKIDKGNATIAGRINNFSKNTFFNDKNALKVAKEVFPAVKQNVNALLVYVNQFFQKEQDEKLDELDFESLETGIKFLRGETSYIPETNSNQMSERAKSFIDTTANFKPTIKVKVNKNTETYQANISTLENKLNDLNESQGKLNTIKTFVNKNLSTIKKSAIGLVVAVTVAAIALGVGFGVTSHNKEVDALQNDINSSNSEISDLIERNEQTIDDCLNSVISKIAQLNKDSVSWNLKVNGDQAIKNLKKYSDLVDKYFTIITNENGEFVSATVKNIENLSVVQEPQTEVDYLNNLILLANSDFENSKDASNAVENANNYKEQILEDLNSIESSVKGLKDPEISQEVWKDVDFSDLNDERLGGTIQSKKLTFGDDNSATLKIFKLSKDDQVYMQIVKIEDVSQLIADGIVDANDINYIIQNGLKETYEDYASILLNKNKEDRQTKYFFIKDLNSVLTPGRYEVKYYWVLKDGTTIQDSKHINNSKGSLTKEKIADLAYQDALNIDDSYEK